MREEPEPDAPVPSPPRRFWRRFLASVGGGALGALVVVLMLLATGVVGRRSTVVQKEDADPAPGPRTQGSVVDIARRVRPAIVTISVSGAGAAGVGSGVIFRSDGHILTSQHVIRGASQVTVDLASGKTLTGRVIGSDAETDIAVVRVDGSNLPVATLGSASGLEVGQLAVAVGSPLGLAGGPSVTVGVISALGRKVTVPGGKDLLDMVQTDAPISPGSSGGALLNDKGAVVGITTAVAGYGLGLAVPVNATTRRIMAELMSGGRVRRAWIGVGGSSAPLPPSLAERFGRRHGVRVTQVVPGSPADVAGLRPGDLLVSVADRPIAVIQDLTRFMLDAPIHGRLPVTVVRSGAFVDVVVVPAELVES